MYAPQLYDWQKHALTSWYARKRGIIQATTGSGKTRCAVHAYLRTKPRICYVVVPKVALLHEWDKAFSEEGLSAQLKGGKHNMPIGEINVMTINTARKLLLNADPKNAMLIVDEVHRSSSPKNRAIYTPKWEYCLGLSATAFQNGTSIARLCGGIVYDYNFEDALADGVVNDYKVTNVGYVTPTATRRELNQIAERLRILRGIIVTEYGGPSSDDGWPMYVAELVSDGDGTAVSMQHLWLERKRLLWADEIRTEITCELIKQHAEDRIVIFHQDIRGVEAIASALVEDYDYDPTLVVTEHSAMHRTLRDENLESFRCGDARILISCRTLDEGFNVPNVNVGIIAASSSTSTQYIQRMGRILRKKADSKPSQCYRISAKNTVDEYATHNLLSSGAVDATRVEFRNWDEKKKVVSDEYIKDLSGILRLSALTIGKTTDGRYFLPGRTKSKRNYIVCENHERLSEYLSEHNFNCGRFRISHDNNLYVWLNERFANIGKSPINWQSLRYGSVNGVTVRLELNWISMYENVPATKEENK